MRNPNIDTWERKKNHIPGTIANPPGLKGYPICIKITLTMNSYGDITQKNYITHMYQFKEKMSNK